MLPSVTGTRSTIAMKHTGKKKHHILRTIFLYIPLGYVLVSISLVFLFKWAPVYITPLMVIRMFQTEDRSGNAEADAERAYLIRKKWMPLDEISPNMYKAVIASEDQRFYSHKGFDYEELSKMMKEHRTKGKPVRGCSTISQQTAKNCFTFCTRTWARKVFEAYYTVLIERIWGKERILEVYLNVAEMGPRIYGAEAACKTYFGHSAQKMTKSEAASIAVCLPNPLKRTPKWVERHMSGQRSKVINSMN